MNYNNNDPSLKNKGRNIAVKYAVLAVLAVLLSAAAAKTEYYFMLLVAAACTAYVSDNVLGSVTALFAAGLSFGAEFLITKSVFTAASYTVTVIVIAALFIVCRRFNPGFFKSSVIIGAGCAVTLAAAFAVSLYIGSGTFTENLAAFKASFEEAVRNGVTRIAQSSDGMMTISQNDLDLAIATMITLIPGAFAYSIFKLLTKIFGGKIGRKEGEFSVPPSCMLFFALSVVLSMIFSLFKSLEVAELAAVNLAIALAPATLFNGAYKIVYKMRHPLIVVLPDGTKVRRVPIFLVGAIFLSALISFLFPIFIIILYSIFSTVKELIINSRKQDGK